MVTITHENNELIASGEFFTMGNGTTTLVLKHELDSVKVIFDVSEDKNDESNKMNGEIIGSDTLKINLKNFWNKIGVPLGPDLLGSISGRKLYMILLIAGMRPSKSKKISYSFYLGEATNG